MKHFCHATNCRVEVAPEKLMCPHHWAIVPRYLQLLVNRNFRTEQCQTKKPTREWVQVARKAVDFVEIKERREAAQSLRQALRVGHVRQA